MPFKQKLDNAITYQLSQQVLCRTTGKTRQTAITVERQAVMLGKQTQQQLLPFGKLNQFAARIPILLPDAQVYRSGQNILIGNTQVSQPSSIFVFGIDGF